MDPRKCTTYILFCIFGISSWVTINGIFVELPNLVDRLPEGWNIGAQLGLAIQASNIFALVFFFVARRPNSNIPYHISVYCLLLLGTCTTFLLAFFWSNTSFLFGKERSVSLIILSFAGGAVDCLTTVIYWPYVAKYESLFTSGLAVGEGLSGGVISLIGFAQNQTKTSQNFGVDVFFCLVAIFMIFSTIAFTVIHFTSIGQRYVMRKKIRTAKSEVDASSSLLESNVHEGPASPVDEVPLSDFEILRIIRWPLVVQFLVAFVENGMTPAITTYAFLNYTDGHRIMALSTNASLIVNPLTCLLAAWFQFKQLALLMGCTLLLATYYLVCALMSPSPPLVQYVVGGWTMMIIAVLLRVFLAYTKTIIYYKIKEDVKRECAERSFRWSGFVTQVGSGLGTLLFFLLVTFTTVFHK